MFLLSVMIIFMCLLFCLSDFSVLCLFDLFCQNSFLGIPTLAYFANVHSNLWFLGWLLGRTWLILEFWLFYSSFWLSDMWLVEFFFLKKKPWRSSRVCCLQVKGAYIFVEFLKGLIAPFNSMSLYLILNLYGELMSSDFWVVWLSCNNCSARLFFAHWVNWSKGGVQQYRSIETHSNNIPTY